MKPKIFITNNLKQLAEKYPSVRFSYAYRSVSKTHVVQVEPRAFFESDRAYLEDEYLLETAFNKMFPGEDILFISSGSLMQLDYPEKTFGSLLFSFESSQDESQLDIEGLYVEVSYSTKNLQLAKAA